MSTDPHLVHQELIPFGISPIYPRGQKPQAEAKKIVGDSLYIQKKMNEWTLILDVNELGKVNMKAEKTIGRIGRSGNTGTEAKIRIELETTDNRVPLVKTIGSNGYNVKFVEVDDEKNRTTESFKTKNESYETSETYAHTWPNSSVLTTSEFFQEIIPEFEELLKEKILDGYVSKISDSASKVQKPFNRNYVNCQS